MLGTEAQVGLADPDRVVDRLGGILRIPSRSHFALVPLLTFPA